MALSNRRDRPSQDERPEYRLYLPPALSAALHTRARTNGIRMLDEICEALEAHLKTSLHPPMDPNDRRLSKLDHWTIRGRWKRGETQASLAREYGLTRHWVHVICHAADPGNPGVIRV